MTAAVLHILLSLAAEDRHGLGIAADVKAFTNGRLTLGPGTLYGTIKRLLDGGLIEDLGQPGARERKRGTGVGARRRAAAAEIVMSRGIRLFRLLLRLYPRAFRLRFEPEMIGLFEERRAAAGNSVSDRLTFWRATYPRHHSPGDSEDDQATESVRQGQSVQVVRSLMLGAPSVKLEWKQL